MARLRNIAASVADLVWPPRCGACLAVLDGDPLDEGCFCPGCRETLVYATSPLCTQCGVPFGGTGPDHLCALCLGKPPQFVRARSPLLYGGALSQAVSRFKYGAVPELGKPFGRMLVHSSRSFFAPDMVVPVPLHPARLRTRGFNQSALLAAEIARQLDAPLLTNALIRTRNTPSQAGMNRQERLCNLKNAFAVRKQSRLKQRRVLLVDDIITTTATIRETASVLMGAGVASVAVIALARTPEPNSPVR